MRNSIYPSLNMLGSVAVSKFSSKYRFLTIAWNSCNCLLKEVQVIYHFINRNVCVEQFIDTIDGPDDELRRWEFVRAFSPTLNSTSVCEKCVHVTHSMKFPGHDLEVQPPAK